MEGFYVWLLLLCGVPGGLSLSPEDFGFVQTPDLSYEKVCKKVDGKEEVKVTMTLDSQSRAYFKLDPIKPTPDPRFPMGMIYPMGTIRDGVMSVFLEGNPKKCDKIPISGWDSYPFRKKSASTTAAAPSSGKKHSPSKFGFHCGEDGKYHRKYTKPDGTRYTVTLDIRPDGYAGFRFSGGRLEGEGVGEFKGDTMYPAGFKKKGIPVTGWQVQEPCKPSLVSRMFKALAEMLRLPSFSDVFAKFWQKSLMLVHL